MELRLFYEKKIHYCERLFDKHLFCTYLIINCCIFKIFHQLYA